LSSFAILFSGKFGNSLYSYNTTRFQGNGNIANTFG
jgi:hypothetical protein